MSTVEQPENTTAIVINQITKTDAMKNYLLREVDLKDLHFIERPLKRFKRTSVKLYLESDIIAKSLSIWGSLEGMELEKQNKLEKLKALRLKRQAKAQIQMDLRRQELSQGLAQYGLQIRPDSTLCDNYIDGSLSAEWTVATVVDTCRMMNWLHTCTNYQKQLNDLFNQRNKRRNNRYNRGDRYSDYEDFSDDERDEDGIDWEIENIRKSIIKKHGGGFPWRKAAVQPQTPVTQTISVPESIPSVQPVPVLEDKLNAPL